VKTFAEATYQPNQFNPLTSKESLAFFVSYPDNL